MQALRVPTLGPLAVPGLGNVRLDPARILYFGHSQGATVGVPAVATQNGARAVILSGLGAYLTRALLAKTSPFPVKPNLQQMLGETISENHPVVLLWQHYFDVVDTINTLPLLVQRPPAGLSSKHVFMTWGQNDTFSPRSTLRAAARAGGFPQVLPVHEDPGTSVVPRPLTMNQSAGDGATRTVGVFQYQPANYDGHFVAERHPDAIRDWLAFITSFLQNGQPLVP
jgi:pimeloyl-ACP methyl ester carboxylesterase